MSYPPELRQRAVEMVEQGVRPAVVAAGLGVSTTTLRRWTDPDYDEHSRQSSRRAKDARRHPCSECGKPIWYTSVFCADCHHKQLRAGRRWTRERIITAIQDWAREHGKPPSATDWRRADSTHPSVTTIYDTRNAAFSSWSEAIASAGFTPKKGVGPGKSNWTVEEAQELRSQGLTDREIARRFGVSPSAIGQRAGKRSLVKPRKHRNREQRIRDLRTALRKGEQDGHRT